MVGFSLPEQVETLREQATRCADEQLAPAARTSEQAGEWAPEILEVIRGFALSELDLPAELGGVDLGALAKGVLLEALARGDAGGLFGADPLGLAAGALRACPDRASASRVAAACLTGDAQAALQVLDVEDPTPSRVAWAPAWPPPRFVWQIQGDRLRLLEPTAEPEPIRALAFQASGAVSVSLQDAALLGDWTLSAHVGVEVRGRARLWAAAVALGVAQDAFDGTVTYTRERIVFGKPVAHHQGNAFDLAGVATTVHGARLMVRAAAAALDQATPHAGFWATQAWLTAIDAAVAVTDLGIQLLGGHGFLVDHLAEKRFREARMLGLVAGGRDVALCDVAALSLQIPHPLFGAGIR